MKVTHDTVSSAIIEMPSQTDERLFQVESFLEDGKVSATVLIMSGPDEVDYESEEIQTDTASPIKAAQHIMKAVKVAQIEDEGSSTSEALIERLIADKTR